MFPPFPPPTHGGSSSGFFLDPGDGRNACINVATSRDAVNNDVGFIYSSVTKTSKGKNNRRRNNKEQRKQRKAKESRSRERPQKERKRKKNIFHSFSLFPFLTYRIDKQNWYIQLFSPFFTPNYPCEEPIFLLFS